MPGSLVGVDEFLVDRRIDARHGPLVGGLGSILVTGMDRFDHCFDLGSQPRTQTYVVQTMFRCLTRTLSCRWGIGQCLSA